MIADAASQGPRRDLLIAMFLGIFAAAAGTHALTPIFPELKNRLQVGDAEVRALTSIFTIGYAVSGFVLGVLCDVLGRRRVLLTSLLIYVAANGLLLFSESYGAFLALRGLAGLGTGGISAAVLATTADLVAYARRGRALSFVLSGSYAAVVIGMPLAAELAKIRLSLVFGFLGALALSAFIPLCKHLPDDARPRGRGLQGAFGKPLQAISLVGARGALLVTFLNTLAAFCVITSLADHCVDRFGASLDARTVLFITLGVAAIPGAIAAGMVSDRFGKRRSVILALLGSVMILPGLLIPSGFTAFLIPAAFVAWIQALRQGPFAAILTSLSPESLRGTLIGWNSAASGIGLAAGSLVGGVAYGQAGLPAVVSVSCGALSLSLLAFLTLVPDLDSPRGASASVEDLPGGEESFSSGGDGSIEENRAGEDPVGMNSSGHPPANERTSS